MSLELAEKIEMSEDKSFEQSKIDELRHALERQDESGIGFPFDFNVVEALHAFQNEPAIEALIRDKQAVLKRMLDGMENEIELGYSKKGGREQEVYNLLKELTRDNVIQKQA
jgi:hypothetical protein